MIRIDNVIGAIVGDVVGSVYEFRNHRSKEFPLFCYRCFATDDSIMTLAVAKALMDSANARTDLSEVTVRAMQSVGGPYPGCGYGRSFFRWMYTENPKPYNSYGNGAAMRVSAVANVAKSEEDVKKLSALVTGVTHNHPEGLKGAEAVAVANWMGLNGCTKTQIAYKMESYYDLNFTIDEIRPFYKFNETCQMTVPQAIKAFLEGNDFEDVLRTAISVGGDSDTLAAIACSIAGAYYGVPNDIAQTAKTYLDEKLSGILRDFERFVCLI